MNNSIPITIGGRDLDLYLDLRAMYEAEKVAPELSLIATDEDGWHKVATDATALLAVVYGCLWRDRPGRMMTSSVDGEYLSWLGEHLGPKDIHSLQNRLSLLYAMAIAIKDEEVETTDSNPQTAEAQNSHGSASGHTPDTTSESQTTISGIRRFVKSITLLLGFRKNETSTTIAPGSYQQ